jgi:hypothetical protein
MFDSMWMSRPLARTVLALSTTATVAIATTGCDQLQDVVDDNKSKLNVPIETEQSAEFPIDFGAISGAAAGQPSPADLDQVIPIPPADVDLNKESKPLADNKKLIKRFEIVGITATPTTNTATMALPAIELWIGPFGAKDTANAVKIATIPSIPAGSTEAAAATIDAAGMDAAQATLLTLAFTQLTSAKLVVKKGDPMPSGAANLKITMKIKATLNPI